MASEVYPRALLLERSEAYLIHKDCNGEIEPIPEHGAHCLECNRPVGNWEVIEDPNSQAIPCRLTGSTGSS